MSPRRSASAWRFGPWLAIVLLAFVVVAVIVVRRRERGLTEEARLVELDRTRRDLDAQRVALERDLRQAGSRDRIESAAERRLGMRVPSDSQIITLVRSRGVAPAVGAAAVETR
jgi:cell division protein FtsL